MRISFPIVDNREICLIEVSQGQQPIVIKVSDKNGQQTEKFYVRSGNSSVEMPLSEMHAYISERFS